MSDLFISYASEDRPWVKTLAEALEQEGRSVWWDRTIPTGRRYHRVIEEALEAARCVLVVWSQNSVDSDWVRAEAGAGMARNALVPVSIDPSEPPLVFRQLQTADLSQWRGDRSDPSFQKLVGDIGSLLGASATAVDRGTVAPPPARSMPPEETPRAGMSRKPWVRAATFAGALIAATALIFWIQSLVREEDKGELPRIVEFSVSPEEVRSGQSATIRWATENADNVVLLWSGIEPQKVQPSGTRAVDPEEDTTYRLRATNSRGKTEERASITVDSSADDPPPVTPVPEPRIQADVRPAEITEGQRAKLSWSSSNASQVEIRGMGRVGLSDSKIVTPSETTEYMFVATNETGQTAQATVRLNVRPGVVEDCVSFDPENAATKQSGTRWLIVDGTHSLFNFENSQAEARQALAIIRTYRTNQSCFVGRPQPSFTYLLVSGRPPSGTARGEDCIPFDLSRVELVNRRGRWTIVSENQSMFSFDDQESEGRQALAIIKHHGFTHSCFVGRPQPSLTYLRR